MVILSRSGAVVVAVFVAVGCESPTLPQESPFVGGWKIVSQEPHSYVQPNGIRITFVSGGACFYADGAFEIGRNVFIDGFDGQIERTDTGDWQQTSPGPVTAAMSGDVAGSAAIRNDTMHVIVKDGPPNSYTLVSSGQAGRQVCGIPGLD